MANWLRRGRPTAPGSNENFPRSTPSHPALPPDTNKLLRSTIKVAWEPSGSLFVAFPDHTVAFYKGRSADRYVAQGKRAFRRRSSAADADAEEEEDDDDQTRGTYSEDEEAQVMDEEPPVPAAALSPYIGGGLGFNDAASKSHTDDGLITPRPGDRSPRKEVGELVSKRLAEKSINNRLRALSFASNQHDERELRSALRSDISMVVRKRALMGYAMDSVLNIDLLAKDEFQIIALWDWITLSEKLAEGQKAHVRPFDFSFQGVQSIWSGFTPVFDHRQSEATKKTTSFFNRSTPQPVSSSIERAYNVAVTDWAKKSGFEDIFVITSAKEDRRKAALASCGFGFPRSQLEQVLKELEDAGNYPKAAGWALFHGNTERSIRALNASGDQRLKIMATAIAGYLNTREHPEQNNAIWQELCRSLSVDLDEPYLRAIFAYIASGDWTDVLDEPSLPLKDQIGIALRFLTDEQLSGFIADKTRRAIDKGDLEGIVLTGLASSQTIDLFEKYVNRTGDVQTAALAMSYCVPRDFRDERVEMWIDNYRHLLDRWSLFHIRAKFDIARGNHLRSFAPAAVGATETVDGISEGPSSLSSTSSNETISMNKGTFGSHLNGYLDPGLVHPQVIVRCNFCNTSIAHANYSAPGTPRVTIQTMLRQRITNCPHCQKPLPRCAICLMHMGTAPDSVKEVIAVRNGEDTSTDKLDWWFTFCQTCRHGGHAGHMDTWFRSHLSCPVSDCDCNCAAIR